MSKLTATVIGTAVAVASLTQIATVATAAPRAAPATLVPAQSSIVEQVQWRRGGRWHRGGRGIGIGAAILGGAIIGGALAQPYYSRPYYSYPRATYYYGPGDDAVAYCSQRFRSYDPASGTYLGYDGLRHPCP